jgi:hypothetical protein
MNEIEVRTRFDGAWVRGFEVAEETASGEQPAVRLRRRSDGTVLPDWFTPDEVRAVPERNPQLVRGGPAAP